MGGGAKVEKSGYTEMVNQVTKKRRNGIEDADKCG